MSKPDDIPQDVWDKAFHEMDCHCPAVMFGDDTLQHSVNTAISRAIMDAKAEEREACACRVDLVADGIAGLPVKSEDVKIASGALVDVLRTLSADFRKRVEG